MSAFGDIELVWLVPALTRCRLRGRRVACGYQIHRDEPQYVFILVFYHADTVARRVRRERVRAHHFSAQLHSLLDAHPEKSLPCPF
jgi:hypothetical protein